MTYRARNIVLAVALAVVAALLTGFYVTNYKRSVQHGEHQVTVLVAAKDIPSGTAGEDLDSHHLLKAVSVPRRDVVPGAISQPDQVDKLVATQQTYAGEQVSTRRFSSPSNSGVRAQLKGPLRAVAFTGTPTQVLAGTLKTGDAVDLIGNFKVPESSQIHVSRVVLRDLKVLQAPPSPGAAGKLEGPNQDVPVMLAVSDTQLQKLWWVVNNGDGAKSGWSLALRPQTDPSDSPEVVEWWKTELLDGLDRSQLKRAKNGGLR